MHLDVRAALAGDPPKLEYLLSLFVFAEDGAPDYTHVPAYRRGGDYVVGDRAFYAPAAIVQKGPAMMALVPDVESINRHVVYADSARPVRHARTLAVPVAPDSISMPTALNLGLDEQITGGRPLLSYGMMDYVVEQHVYWRHENAGGAMARTLSRPEARYGHAERQRDPRLQALPFAEYAAFSYPASFAYEGSAVDTEGGARLAAARRGVRQRRDGRAGGWIPPARAARAEVICARKKAPPRRRSIEQMPALGNRPLYTTKINLRIADSRFVSATTFLMSHSRLDRESRAV